MHVTSDYKNFSCARFPVSIDSTADWTESGLKPVVWSHSLKSQMTSEHDSTLLLTAVEELERSRLAIEWLFDADLLRHFMA